MLLRHKLTSFVVVMFLASCGFQPVYQKNPSGVNNEARSKLLATSIDVESEEARPAQELKNNLEDLFNSGSASGEMVYTLKVKLAREIAPLVIQQDRRITRYNVIYRASYELFRKGTLEVLFAGTTKMVGSYDAFGSEYTVYAAETDTGSRVLKELAKDIEIRVSSEFVNGKG